MTQNSTEKERAEFEAVIVGQWPSLVPVWSTRENRYFDTKVRKLWWLWQAARRAPVAPEGSKLVPVNPTEQMEQAAADYLGACVKAWGLWHAMLAAAPEPQEPQ